MLCCGVCAGWGQAQGFSVDIRRAEAFNTLVFGEIGYSITTRFVKASTFHPRVFKGNPWCVCALLLVTQQLRRCQQCVRVRALRPPANTPAT